MEKLVTTFSIVAYDPAASELGCAVASRVFGVGAIVPWIAADIGAIATQAMANTTFGSRGLEYLKFGKSPVEVIEKVLASDEGRERRQVGIVTAKGESFAFTGTLCREWAGHRFGENYSIQGNTLKGESVIVSMEKEFLNSKGALSDRLLSSLKNGQASGGDQRGKQSAAIMVYRRNGGFAGFDDRYVDIRVDDHAEPVEELSRLLEVWKGRELASSRG